MTPDELQQLLRQPESEQLEFKSALPKPDQLAALVAAFANTRGGTLVVGADERQPKAGGLAHPGVTAGHAQQWIEEHVKPVPPFSVDVVSLEPGRHFVVVTVEPAPARPYIADGRALERRGDRLVPITPQRIIERATAAPSELERLANVIATLAELVERLEHRLHWKRQLPLQAVLVLCGAVIGYLLGLWNPLS